MAGGFHGPRIGIIGVVVGGSEGGRVCWLGCSGDVERQASGIGRVAEHLIEAAPMLIITAGVLVSAYLYADSAKVLFYLYLLLNPNLSLSLLQDNDLDR